jgi:cobalt/nickel transport protein
MQKISAFCLICALLLLASTSSAHFAMLIANPPEVNDMAKNKVIVHVRFWHPRLNQGMEMEKPAALGVWNQGQKQDLLAALSAVKEAGLQTWRTTYSITAPGDYIFYVSPSPYWEEAENTFIVHHTKVIVSAYDLQEGWDQALGLPMEIIPLTRPYGLYPGNVFSAQVLCDGKPLPNCAVEVEYYDPRQQKVPATEALTTQVVKTNDQGYFQWSFPWPGWWGMAALASAEPITWAGKTGDLEAGGVLWVYVDPLPTGK